MDKRFNYLPQEMRTAIEVLQELHNVPDSMALQAVLGTVNLAVQCHFDVNSEIYGIRPTSLFLVGLAPTGALKSTIIREISGGIMQYRDDMRKLLENDLLRYRLEEKKYNNEEKAYLKGIDDDPSLQMPEPPKPVETYDYCVSKGTLNGLIDILKSQSFLGLFSSEAGEFFSGHAFQGKNSSQGIEMCLALTKMWDGDVIEKNTGMERSKLWNRRVMMLFLLQTEVVQEVLNNKLFSEQGFIHRILITQTPKFEKLDWDLSDGALERVELIRRRLEPFNNKVYKTLRQPLNLIDPNKFEIQPTVIQNSETSRLLLGNFYNENKHRGQEDLKRYAGFSERLHEHALRIAATLAAFDGKTIIEDIHALAAIDLIDFYCEQRLQLEIGVQDKDPIQTDSVVRMKDWITEKSWKGTRNNLDMNGPYWYRKLGVTQRQKILEDLVVEDFLIVEEKITAKNRTYIEYSMNSIAISGDSIAENAVSIAVEEKV